MQLLFLCPSRKAKKMSKLFFQVANAGGVKAAGSLHVSPNSINRVLILTTPVMTCGKEFPGQNVYKITLCDLKTKYRPASKKCDQRLTK